MKHQISVHSDIPHINTPALTAHIKRCIRGALEQEGVTVPCEINVLLTDNRGIREINRDLRDVDRETDVLSFPMFEFTRGSSLRTYPTCWIPAPVCCPWGIWRCPWRRSSPRRRNSAIARSGKSAT